MTGEARNMEENTASANEFNLPEKEIPLEFTGKASEYFGIWIVNILLTIITLGIYAPWAKVRNKKYLYGNTLLENSPFDFIANPVTILKGYLLALGFYVLFSVSSNFYPLSGLFFLFLFLLIFPWVVVRSMSFRLANTTYRNIRFHFERDYAESYKVFLGIGLLIPLTLGFIFPYYHYRQVKFVVDKSSFGTSRFDFDTKVGNFYIIYVIIWGVFACLGVLMAVAMPLMLAEYPELAALMQGQEEGQEVDPELQQALFTLITIMYAILGVVYIAVFAYMQAALNNLLWNNVSIAKQRFRSTLTTPMMVWLYLTNSVCIVISFGLLIPWARIRMMRYRLKCLTVLSKGDLDGFIAGEKSKLSAAGEEIGEVFGLDIGI